MAADSPQAEPATPGAAGSRVRPAALVLKLALAAALSATLAIGAERPLPVLCLLLQALCVALGGLSLAIALIRRETPRPGVYGCWHEAAAFGVLGLAAHLALVALR